MISDLPKANGYDSYGVIPATCYSEKQITLLSETKWHEINGRLFCPIICLFRCYKVPTGK